MHGVWMYLSKEKTAWAFDDIKQDLLDIMLAIESIYIIRVQLCD